MNIRVCNICNKEKSLSKYNKGKYPNYVGDKVVYTQNRCRDCGKKMFKEWYKKKTKDPKYRKQQAKKTRKWYRNNREFALRRNKEIRKAKRQRVLKKYGGKCVCCGENTYEFLGIDHIDNNGAEHRKKISRGIYEYLEKNNYPKDNYQILCHNCNTAKGLYGKCPHNG